MSESIFNWLKRAKAQPGTGNVPSDLPSGAAQRKADALEAGPPDVQIPKNPSIGQTPGIVPPSPSYTPSPEQQEFIKKQGLRSDAMTGGTAALAAGTAMVPWNPVQAQAPGPVIEGVKNPNVAKGGLSAEGKAWQASRPPLTATPPTAAAQPAAAGGLRAGLGAATRIAGAAGLALSAAGAANEAGKQTADVNLGLRAATPENRPQRALELAKAAMNPFGIFGGGEAQAAQEPPPQTEQSGSIPPPADLRSKAVSVNPQDWQQNKLGMDNTTIPAFLPNADGTSTQYEVPRGGYLFRDEQTGKMTASVQSNPDVAIANEVERMRAARDAENSVRLGYGQGLRSKSPSMGGRFGGAFGALSRLQGYGAAGRLAKNQSDADIARAGVGLRADANRLAAARLQHDMNKDSRDYNLKVEESNEKEADRLLEGRARQQIEASGPIDNATGAHKEKVAAATAKLQDEYRHTAANMRDAQGRKMTLGKLSQSQVQQIHMMDDIRNKLDKSRDSIFKKLPEYVGNKRTNSRDLNDYQPVGYEKSATPGVAKWVVLRSGERIPVTDLGGGKFRIFGPNDPMDKQLLEMADAAEARKKAK